MVKAPTIKDARRIKSSRNGGQQHDGKEQDRIQDRFLSGDAESHSEEMLLELLLTFAIGRKDVKPLAEELIRVFGSLSPLCQDSCHLDAPRG